MVGRVMAGIVAWTARLVPTRDSLVGNRWLGRFGHRLAHPSLWHFNRRSVPRGVALGLSVAFIIPFAHMLVAAALAFPLRANVAIAAAVTWVSNPLTWVVIFPLEYAIGKFLIGLGSSARAPDVGMDAATMAPHSFGWILQTTGEIALGSVVLAVVAGVTSYFIMKMFWRMRVAYRWRNRKHA